MGAGRRDGRIGAIEHADGARLFAAAMDEAFAFECLQVLADGTWGAEAGSTADFPDGGGITGVAREGRDVFKDLLLTTC